MGERNKTIRRVNLLPKTRGEICLAVTPVSKKNEPKNVKAGRIAMRRRLGERNKTIRRVNLLPKTRGEICLAVTPVKANLM